MNQPANENPLIVDARAETDAVKKPTKEALQGAGVAQDFIGGVSLIADGEWTEGLLDIAGGAVDLAMGIKNPAEMLISMGLGWVMEHLSPLKDFLDKLTGSQDELDLTVQTWVQISSHIQQVAQELTTSVQQDCATWTGGSADQYRQFVQDRLDRYAQMSDDAMLAARFVDISKTLLNIVRSFIRGLITDTCAKLIMILFRYPPPAYPAALAAEGMPVVVEKTTEGLTVMQKFVRALSNAGVYMKQIWERLTKALAKDENIGQRAAMEAGKEISKKTIQEKQKEIAAERGGKTATGDQSVIFGETDRKEQEDRQKTQIFPTYNAPTMQTLSGNLDSE
ncbi:hypothetical protein [Amycolatopsis suaedae]|uniref:WXG100 family type VII secretion target n=1 Tax=Amycolatopsis suaedae TaxID=2510978 RepID=A0A4Q7JB96_9PSEU|nr:hypothetical protein [Amycolatopsis suaedae]RZQ64252.1 hypothetical protein EWH70_09735 [Amycolatopsis suaedae]